MIVGLNLCPMMRRIRTRAIIDGTPPLPLLTYLAHIAPTALTNQMSAFIDPHSLMLDFFAADPAAILIFQFL